MKLDNLRQNLKGWVDILSYLIFTIHQFNKSTYDKRVFYQTTDKESYLKADRKLGFAATWMGFFDSNGNYKQKRCGVRKCQNTLIS